MKVACGATYVNTLYGSFQAGAYRTTPKLDDLLESIRWASQAGFEGLEFEILTPGQLSETFAIDNLPKIRHLSEECKIAITNLFVPYVIRSTPDLSDWNGMKEKFRQSVEIAESLGCSIIALNSPPYPYAEQSNDLLYPYGPPSRIIFHRGGEWSRFWQSYVSWTGALCDIARQHGAKLAIEPRPREIISNSDAMLLLLDSVKSSALGVLFDTAHHFLMKEVLPLSIWKLGKSILSVHLSDNDGITEHHWAPGEGNIDWLETLKAFENENYEGFLSIEMSGIDQSAEDLIHAKARVMQWLEKIEPVPLGRQA